MAALEGIIVDVKVPFFELIDGDSLGASGEGRAHRAELHRDQFRLGDDIAVPVQERRRAVARLAHDRRIGRADEFCTHFARRRAERLADHGVIDGVKLHSSLFLCIRRLLLASISAHQRGGSRTVEVDSSISAGPSSDVPGARLKRVTRR